MLRHPLPEGNTVTSRKMTHLAQLIRQGIKAQSGSNWAKTSRNRCFTLAASVPVLIPQREIQAFQGMKFKIVGFLSHPLARARVRWIRAAGRFFVPGRSISSIYRRSRIDFAGTQIDEISPIYRRYIDNIYRRYIECNIFMYLMQASVKGSRGPCLKGSHLRGT